MRQGGVDFFKQVGCRAGHCPAEATNPPGRQVYDLPYRIHTRSRRNPAAHPPDPSLSSPIPQHLTWFSVHAPWRFLIEGDKGMAQERQPLAFPESHSSSHPSDANARDRDATYGPTRTFARAEVRVGGVVISLSDAGRWRNNILK